MTEVLMINFLFLLIPVLAYLIFYENKVNPYNHKILIFLFSALTMSLCMTFPIKLELGFIFDLRYIPFIIASLFGGYQISIPLWIVLNLYRFFIGGDGVFFSLIFSTIVLISTLLIYKSFNRLSSKNRILTASLVSLFTMSLYLLHISSFYETLTSDFWLIVSNAITIHVVGTLIVMILIQKIIHNVKTRERYHNIERLNVISELSASISHEIRNPLTVTNGFLQLLKKSTNLNQNEQQYLDYSLQELKRAEKIVSDFLSLAKPQAQNMVYSDFKNEIEYVHNIMIPYANIHHVSLEFSFNNTLSKYFDKNQFIQCMVNLYKNGIEAMKSSGGILRVEVSEHKNNIIIKIQDSGLGMTKEEIMRLGKPYYSTKQEGTGLGMLLVYSTIYKIKGKIEVISEKGKGTAFILTIPI
jgi:two-component system, sporulation sensor kinase B